MCGGSVFKAASVDSKEASKTDVTGIIVSACRHALIRGAINMHHGETFTHTHFMHLLCHRLNCRSFCYDVACRYWTFAKKVGYAFPEFKQMTTSMNAFLPMMHAKAHHLPCQVLYSFQNFNCRKGVNNRNYVRFFGIHIGLGETE